jgi:hypothetical protein
MWLKVLLEDKRGEERIFGVIRMMVEYEERKVRRVEQEN